MVRESFPGSTPEQPPDARQMLLKGRYEEALKAAGEDAVREEISEMIFKDLANYALKAADALGFRDLAERAAFKVQEGGYGSDKEAEELTQKYIKK